jgi:hypothetical protein
MHDVNRNENVENSVHDENECEWNRNYFQEVDNNREGLNVDQLSGDELGHLDIVPQTVVNQMHGAVARVAQMATWGQAVMSDDIRTWFINWTKFCARIKRNYEGPLLARLIMTLICLIMCLAGTVIGFFLEMFTNMAFYGGALAMLEITSWDNKRMKGRKKLPPRLHKILREQQIARDLGQTMGERHDEQENRQLPDQSSTHDESYGWSEDWCSQQIDPAAARQRYQIDARRWKQEQIQKDLKGHCGLTKNGRGKTRVTTDGKCNAISSTKILLQNEGGRPFANVSFGESLEAQLVVDSGANISILGEELKSSIFEAIGEVPVQQISTIAKCHNGTQINVHGLIHLDITFQGLHDTETLQQVKFYITHDDILPILGTNIMHKEELQIHFTKTACYLVLQSQTSGSEMHGLTQAPVRPCWDVTMQRGIVNRFQICLAHVRKGSTTNMDNAEVLLGLHKPFVIEALGKDFWITPI